MAEAIDCRAIGRFGEHMDGPDALGGGGRGQLNLGHQGVMNRQRRSCTDPDAKILDSRCFTPAAGACIAVEIVDNSRSNEIGVTRVSCPQKARLKLLDCLDVVQDQFSQQVLIRRSSRGAVQPKVPQRLLIFCWIGRMRLCVRRELAELSGF